MPRSPIESATLVLMAAAMLATVGGPARAGEPYAPESVDERSGRAYDLAFRIMAEGDRPGAQRMLEYVRSDTGSAAAKRANAVLAVVVLRRYDPPAGHPVRPPA